MFIFFFRFSGLGNFETKWTSLQTSKKTNSSFQGILKRRTYLWVRAIGEGCPKNDFSLLLVSNPHKLFDQNVFKFYVLKFVSTLKLKLTFHCLQSKLSKISRQHGTTGVTHFIKSNNCKLTTNFKCFKCLTLLR